MGQQQSRIRLPLKIKLLVGVVILLSAVVGFLIFSTIHLIQTDKRAYIYQLQLLEGSLVSLEISQHVRTARTIPTQGSGFESWFQTQNQFGAVFKYKTDASIATLTPLLQTLKADFPKEFTFSTEWLAALRPALVSNGLAYANLSGPGNLPFLGIVQYTASNSELWLTVLPLQKFVKEMRETHTTITDESGAVLIDSDPAVMFAQQKLTQDPLFQAASTSKVAAGALEYSAIQDSSKAEDWLGSYSRPGNGLVVMSKTRWADAMRGTRQVIIKFLLLGLAAIGGAIVYAMLFARTLTRPLQKLFLATQQIAGGDFNLTVKAESRDEIGALSESFQVMSKKIQELIVESMERVRLQGEMAIASAVQQNLIPQAVFSDENIALHSHYEAASECGGDWWGFFTVGRNTSIMIADATGHGLPSALITAAARSCFSVIHKMAQEDPQFVLSPARMLQFANRAIYESAGGKIMMTFFASCIDHEKKEITYANAGHNPPWLFHKSEAKYALKSLTGKGTRLGESLDGATFEEHTLPVHSEDILFLYTDGLTEGKDSTGKMFGKKAVLKLVESHLDKGPQAIIDALLTDFKTHNGSKPLDDDITLAVARLT